MAEFAGDALTAVFRLRRRHPCNGSAEPCGCALDMQAEMARFQTVTTRAGTFELAMKAGVGSRSAAAVTIMGDPAIRLGYVLAGPALDRAARPSSTPGVARSSWTTACSRAVSASTSWSARRSWSVIGRLRDRSRRCGQPHSPRSTRARRGGWPPSSIRPSPSGCAPDGASS